MLDGKRELSVTIKGEGRDRPWIVFYGMPGEIISQIAETFGFGDEQTEGHTLAEVTVEANRVFQGLINVQAGLGGKVLKQGTGKAKAEPASDPETAQKVEPEATPQAEPETPAEPQEDPLLKQIAEAADMAAITTIWKANQKAFKERADVAEAVKKRRAEIGV